MSHVGRFTRYTARITKGWTRAAPVDSCHSSIVMISFRRLSGPGERFQGACHRMWLYMLTRLASPSTSHDGSEAFGTKLD